MIIHSRYTSIAHASCEVYVSKHRRGSARLHPTCMPCHALYSTYLREFCSTTSSAKLTTQIKTSSSRQLRLKGITLLVKLIISLERRCVKRMIAVNARNLPLRSRHIQVPRTKSSLGLQILLVAQLHPSQRCKQLIISDDVRNYNRVAPPTNIPRSLNRRRFL